MMACRAHPLQYSLMRDPGSHCQIKQLSARAYIQHLCVYLACLPACLLACRIASYLLAPPLSLTSLSSLFPFSSSFVMLQLDYSHPSVLKSVCPANHLSTHPSTWKNRLIRWGPVSPIFPLYHITWRPPVVEGHPTWIPYIPHTPHTLQLYTPHSSRLAFAGNKKKKNKKQTPFPFDVINWIQPTVWPPPLQHRLIKYSHPCRCHCRLTPEWTYSKQV
jgi:hypothetical protein